MKKSFILLTTTFLMLFAVTPNIMAQKKTVTHRKTTTVQKKGSTSSKKSSSVQNFANDGAEISLRGHIDFLLPEGNADDKIQIAKNIKADYVLKLFRDPSDTTRPVRKTAILTCDIDWKALANSDKHVPIDWSWSGKRVITVKQDKGYAIVDGQKNVANLVILKKNGKDFIFIQLLEASLTGLRQGMYVDDLARHIQAEVPGTRIVITGNEKDGLTEYVLLSYGEDKVYDVTGDYHYELNNREPYFTFWFDKNKKLVKWFKLK
jgi:hypothetical protein